MTEELLKALPVLVFAVFFSDDRKDILPAAMSVGIGFSILENTAILVQNLTVVTLGWAALRGLSASLMHGLCTMIIGAGLPYVKKGSCFTPASSNSLPFPQRCTPCSTC